MRGRLCALLLTYCCIITVNASYVNFDVYASGLLASGSDASHPVCGKSFTVLTIAYWNQPVLMCKIFEEISHSLALSLLASHPGAVVTELCCRLMSEQCEGGTAYNVTGSQVILLGAGELFVKQRLHAHGPILLPARRVGFPAAVAQGWLPPSTSACVLIDC